MPSEMPRHAAACVNIKHNFALFPPRSYPQVYLQDARVSDYEEVQI